MFKYWIKCFFKFANIDVQNGKIDYCDIPSSILIINIINAGLIVQKTIENGSEYRVRSKRYY